MDFLYVTMTALLRIAYRNDDNSAPPRTSTPAKRRAGKRRYQNVVLAALCTLLLIGVGYLTLRPVAPSAVVVMMSLEDLLALCRAGNDTAWTAECIRRTAEEDKKISQRSN